ncbi:MAG: hypothetical protein GXY26_04780 [Clostridiales bacterium]|jgi:uncharacterized membrane protein required for colicin V production|nr:hypothetical protein [Clostridiales bacterium]
MKIVFELVFIAILGSSIWTGYKKGLAAGIATLLSIIISMYVGNLLAETFSPEVSKVIRPFVEGYMEGTSGIIDKSLVEIVGDTQGLSVEDSVKQKPDIAHELCRVSFIKMSVYPNTASKMADKAVGLYKHSKISITKAIIDVMSNTIAYYITFIVFFTLAIIILTVIINLINPSLKIPNVQRLNLIGGITAGTLIGLFFCVFASLILKFIGPFISQESSNGLLISKLFLNTNFMSWFLPY